MKSGGSLSESCMQKPYYLNCPLPTELETRNKLIKWKKKRKENQGPVVRKPINLIQD